MTERACERASSGQADPACLAAVGRSTWGVALGGEAP
jgi:hypothetical protein